MGCDAKVGRGVVSTASAERGAERRALDRCECAETFPIIFWISVVDIRATTRYVLGPI